MPEGFAAIEVLAEDLVALWRIRDRLVDAPHIRVAALVMTDERVEAHLDAVRTGLRSVRSRAVVTAREKELHSIFVSAVIALAEADAEQRWAKIRALAGGQEDAVSTWPDIREVVAAIAWSERDVLRHLMRNLAIEKDRCLQAIGIAAIGVRRLDPGEALSGIAELRQVLPRFRAYRTIGQLGRADLMAQLRPGLTDPDPECRFWSAWSAARMGATEPLDTLADIAWNNLPRADRALDLLLRRLDPPQANAWLREFAKLPGRQRALIRATGVIGDPLYIPWLIEHMADPVTARLAGESFSMITGLDLAYRDLDRRPPADFQSGPNDDPADENVALDEDENLPWPDPERIGPWWTANRSRFIVGTPYFLGTPKASADWLEALSDAFQRQRHAAALELAIRQPDKAMFEVRARGRLQRQLIARARGLA
jgi:uncharacterized protein (TIGR02270 family)